jgi:hypothetical protein
LLVWARASKFFHGAKQGAVNSGGRKGRDVLVFQRLVDNADGADAREILIAGHYE